MRPLLAAIPPEYLFWPIVIVLVVWWLVMRIRRATGTWRLRYFAFPRPWLKHLHRHVPLYARLPWELRAPYQDRVLQFVDSKNFRACGELHEVTETMRLIIAGHASMLLLNGSGEGIFPGILSVQVFPRGDSDADGGARSSAVAMVWDNEKLQATDPRDDNRAALSDIARQLGWESAGRPMLPDAMLLTAWARVRSAEFVRKNPGLLEKSASGAAADVFAVATEMFFLAAEPLQQRHPALYAALRLFYQVDPARWTLRK